MMSNCNVTRDQQTNYVSTWTSISQIVYKSIALRLGKNLFKVNKNDDKIPTSPAISFVSLE